MSQASDHVNDGRRCAHLRSVATPVNKCVVVWYRRLCDTVGNHICRGIWRFGSKNSNVLSTITTSDANLSQWLKTTCNHFSAKYGTAHFFTHCKLQPFKLELRMVDLLRFLSGKGLRVDFHPESSRFLCSLLLKIDNRVYRAQYTPGRFKTLCSVRRLLSTDPICRQRLWSYAVWCCRNSIIPYAKQLCFPRRQLVC